MNTEVSKNITKEPVLRRPEYWVTSKEHPLYLRTFEVRDAGGEFILAEFYFDGKARIIRAQDTNYSRVENLKNFRKISKRGMGFPGNDR